MRNWETIEYNDLAILDASVTVYLDYEPDEKLQELARDILKDIKFELLKRKPLVYEKLNDESVKQ